MFDKYSSFNSVERTTHELTLALKIGVKGSGVLLAAHAFAVLDLLGAYEQMFQHLIGSVLHEANFILATKKLEAPDGSMLGVQGAVRSELEDYENHKTAILKDRHNRGGAMFGGFAPGTEFPEWYSDDTRQRCGRRLKGSAEPGIYCLPGPANPSDGSNSEF